jgi:hypothetical protein
MQGAMKDLYTTYPIKKSVQHTVTSNIITYVLRNTSFL